MELIGYIGAALIGTSLGLIGAGGSILTVPLMVYLFQVPVLLASSYSLAVVGFTSLLGAAVKYKQKQIRIKTALLFGIPSIIIVSIIRRFVIPIVPNELFFINGIAVEFSTISMVLFSVLMIVAAYLMIRTRSNKVESPRSNFSRLLVSGVSVGLVTGLLGAGGGFLLIPALVLLLGLPMKEAVGTSLLIIALNSLMGFAMDLSHFNIDWQLLSTVSITAGLGILAGVSISKKIPSQKIKVVFGWFVLLMGVIILLEELLSFFSNIG